MYLCNVCGQTIGPRVPQRKVVVETKRVVHNQTNYKHRGEWVNPKPGEGNQIAKEIAACPACAAAIKDKEVK